MRRRRHSLLVCIKPRFISLLIDGATDSGNLEDEIFNVKFVDAKRGPVQRFLGIHGVRHANADGVLVTVDTGRQSLINSYETTRQYLGATELNTAGRRAEI